MPPARRPPRARNLIDVTYEAMLRGVRAVKPGRHAGRCRPRHPDLRRGPPVLRGARLLRPRHRPALPRAAQRAAFRPPRRRPGAAARHVLHHRADGERRPPRGEGAGRRLDRGHPRPQPVRPVRAHDRRDRRPAWRSSPCRPPAWTSRPTTPDSRRRWPGCDEAAGADNRRTERTAHSAVTPRRRNPNMDIEPMAVAVASQGKRAIRRRAARLLQIPRPRRHRGDPPAACAPR